MRSTCLRASYSHMLALTVIEATRSLYPKLSGTVLPENELVKTRAAIMSNDASEFCVAASTSSASEEYPMHADVYQ